MSASVKPWQQITQILQMLSNSQCSRWINLHSLAKGGDQEKGQRGTTSGERDNHDYGLLSACDNINYLVVLLQSWETGGWTRWGLNSLFLPVLIECLCIHVFIHTIFYLFYLHQKKFPKLHKIPIRQWKN